MQITPEVLLKFSSFRKLPDEQLQKLLGAGEVKLFQSASGEKIITRGSNDDFSFFLVDGALKLIAKDGQTAIIKADSESAKQPITQLKPRQYDVVADGVVSCLKVNAQILESLQANQTKMNTGIQVENDPGHADVYFQLYHDIKHDQVVLPSLPEIALKINRLISGTEKMDARQVGQLIMTDPAIAAKLIKLAITIQKIDTEKDGESFEIDHIVQVINRLGFNKTIELAQVLSSKDLFKPANELHRQVAHELWQESVFISSIAMVLAEEFEHLDPRKAQLIGLTHYVGAFLILNSLSKAKSLVTDSRQMRAIVTELGSTISSMLLENWKFPKIFISAAKDSQYWQRNNESQDLDYCDLVIIAKLLSYVATPKIEHTPILTELPVFRKLNWGKNGVAQGLQTLNRAKQAMHNLLRDLDQ